MAHFYFVTVSAFASTDFFATFFLAGFFYAFLVKDFSQDFSKAFKAFVCATNFLCISFMPAWCGVLNKMAQVGMPVSFRCA